MPASPPTPSRRALALLKRRGVARTSDLESAGLTRVQIARLRDDGVIERVARGLYRLPGADVTEHHDLVMVASRSPDSIVCLVSALRFHDLTTQVAHEVWLAIPRDARAPALEYPPLRVIRMSGQSIEFGVEVHRLEGVDVRMFAASKTVADCFKFRNTVGLDVAIEALQDFRRLRKGTMDDLWRAAAACRVQRVMRPYMEAIA